MTLAWVLLAGAPLLVLGIALFNLAVWPRPRPGARLPGPVSVLIPARDEAANIERCVRAALAQTHPADEVLVYDDRSSDATAALVAALAVEEPQLRLLHGQRLPPGWVGKPHACHCLAAACGGETMVFLDADTVLEPDALARLGGLFERTRADLASVAPRQRVGSSLERLLIPLLQLTYLAWLPLPLVWRTRDPRLVVANGQLLAVERAAYRRAGGWEAVRGEVVDDLAFARRVKGSGGRVVFADGGQVASCRMYRSGAEVWGGFCKNLHEATGGTAGTLGFMLLHTGIFLAPYAALLGWALGVFPDLLGPPAIIGVVANLTLRAALALRLRQPAEGVLLHPLAVAIAIVLALESLRWSRRGRIHWRGRSYPARSARLAA